MTSATSPPVRRLMVGMILVPLIVLLALSAFAWGSARLAPRDLPIGLVGPAEQTQQVEQRLEQDGAFEVDLYGSQDEATAAIEDRDIYGALLLAPDGVTVLQASAASSAVAQTVSRAGTELAAQFGGEQTLPQTVDVMPADADDPTGAGFNSSVLPLVLTGVLCSIIISGLSRPGWTQLGGLVGACALAGLTGGLIIQTWLDIVGGSWLANASVMTLIVLAIATMSAGMGAVMGRSGVVLVSLVMVFVGNPFSAVSSAPEMLPEPAGWVGQMLPPGAGGSLLRSTSFFDGAASAGPLAVLLCWTTLGAACVVWGGWRARGAETEPADEAEPAAAPLNAPSGTVGV
ncbi:ABC transporter permease [Streptomyces sp. URMC 129]|uniref:ABC transporter permease n=1 Tax=Streptomyces sp. URMC 129 TaxID=3423407 RepID=UPI003F1BDA13